VRIGCSSYLRSERCSLSRSLTSEETSAPEQVTASLSSGLSGMHSDCEQLLRFASNGLQTSMRRRMEVGSSTYHLYAFNAHILIVAY
jgi:hypothetical protein